MKQFSAKTVDEAVELACEEFKTEQINLVFKVVEEKTGLIKKATIEVYELVDVVEYAQYYIKDVVDSLGIEGCSANASLDDDVIRISINTSHNPILIGKNGVTLQALNELVRLAVSAKFRHRYRILLDIGDYKDSKYAKVASIARRTAKEVQKTKVNVTLDPMPSDERRIVHSVLSNFSHVKTESVGEGRKRAVNIIYVD